MNTRLAYHFVGETLRDGRPVPADGEWLEHDGKIEMCASGLHASYDPFDALKHASGDTLCLVEVDGDIYEVDDKLVCRRRRIIARIDAAPLLREFARWCALQVIHLWDAPEVVRQYLVGGDESLRYEAARAAEVAEAVRAAGTPWIAEAAREAQREKFNEMVAAAFDGTPAHLLTGWRRERAFEVFERWLDSMGTDKLDEYAQALGYENCDDRRMNFVDDLFDKWLDNECNPPNVEECRL